MLAAGSSGPSLSTNGGTFGRLAAFDDFLHPQPQWGQSLRPQTLAHVVRVLTVPVSVSVEQAYWRSLPRVWVVEQLASIVCCLPLRLLMLVMMMLAVVMRCLAGCRWVGAARQRLDARLLPQLLLTHRH